MTDMVVMNATSMGISGLTNLSTQTGTLGTLVGVSMLLTLIMGVFVSAHSWNTKGWLYRLVKWLINSVGENVLVGVATCSTIGGIYYIGSEMSKFGENNPRFLYDVALFFGEAIIAVAALALIGFFTKPVWEFIYDYASGKKRKVVR